MRRLTAWVALALAVGVSLLGQVPTATASVGAAITGRVVSADSGRPMPESFVLLYAPGSYAKPVAETLTRSDGTFELPAARVPAAGYHLLVHPQEYVGTALPTWLGGERATRLVGSTEIAVKAPASTPVVDTADGPVDLADLAVREGALVGWDHRDGSGNRLTYYTVEGFNPLTRAPGSSAGGSHPALWLLEPGPQTVVFQASPLKASGRQSRAVDLVPGRQTIRVTWPTQFYPTKAPGLSIDGPGRLRGLPARGAELRAVVSLAQESMAVKRSYQWFRGKRRIHGATEGRYVVRADDHARVLRYRVRLQKAGYPTATYWGPRQRIADADARVTTKWSSRTVDADRPRRTTITIKVTWSNGRRPSGTLSLTSAATGVYGVDLNNTLRLRKRDNGVVRMRFPAALAHKLRDGRRHWLFVQYDPVRVTDSDPDRSATVKVRVA